MTNERTLRDALRAEAEREPVPADGWRQISAAVEADARRRRNRRLMGGMGAAVLAAAAAIGVGLVVTGDEQATVEVQSPGTTVTTLPSTSTTIAHVPSTPPASPISTTTVEIGNTSVASTPIEPTTVPPETTVPLPATTVTPPVTTVPPEPTEPVLAVTADGRVVTLDPAGGTEVAQLGTVSLPDTTGEVRGGVGVDQADGVAYYSEPFEQTGRIWRVPLTGGEPEVVALGSYPAVSPDGATLAFARPSANEVSDELVLLDLATGQELSVTTWAPGDPDFFSIGSDLTRLEWSPDGTKLAMEASYEGSWTLVFEPGVDATLTDADQVAFGLISPTWAGPDLVEGVWFCCYPYEASDPLAVRTYQLGNDEPIFMVERPAAFVDRRPFGDRAIELVPADPNALFPRVGTLILRDPAIPYEGAFIWQTTAEYLAAAV